MEPSHFRDLDHRSKFGRLSRSRFRRIFIQRQMRARMQVVIEIRFERFSLLRGAWRKERCVQVRAASFAQRGERRMPTIKIVPASPLGASFCRAGASKRVEPPKLRGVAGYSIPMGITATSRVSPCQTRFVIWAFDKKPRAAR